MNISIELVYKCRGIVVRRSGTFPARRRSSEMVVVDWIHAIKKEMEVDEVIEVIVNGDQNITGEVNEILKAPLQ